MSADGKKRFGIFKILAIVVVLLVAVIIALPFVIDVNKFRPELEGKLRETLAREVKVGNLKLSLLSGTVAVDDISIADDLAFSRTPFISARSFQLGVELKPLIFSKVIRITEILLDKPSITLIRSASGKWNFSSLGNQAGAPTMETPSQAPSSLAGMDISINQLKIANGTVTVIQSEGRGKPSSFSDVNLTATGLSLSSAFPFTLTASLPGGGSLKLEGDAGPVSGADLVMTPLKAKLAVQHFDMVGSGFVAPNSGLAGIVDFSGTLVSDGGKVQSNGHAAADKLQVIKGGSPASKPVSLAYSVGYDLAQHSGTLSDARLEYGEAVAHLNGNYQMLGDSLSLKMRMRGSDMPVQDIKTLLPAFGVTLPKGATLEGGVANADLTAEGPIEKMVTAGSANISKTRLIGFDLAGKMAIVAVLAGLKSKPETDIERFASGVRMSPEGIQVKGLQLIVPALGELSGDGVIRPDQSLDFKMRALLKPSGGLGLGLVRLMKGSGGTLTVPFFVRGTASEPKFVADAKKAADSLLESTLSKQGTQGGQTGTNKLLGDALRDLLQKKKQ